MIIPNIIMLDLNHLAIPSHSQYKVRSPRFKKKHGFVASVRPEFLFFNLYEPPYDSLAVYLEKKNKMKF